MTPVVNVTGLAVGPGRDVPDDLEVDEEDEVAAVAVVDAEVLVLEDRVGERERARRGHVGGGGGGDRSGGRQQQDQGSGKHGEPGHRSPSLLNGVARIVRASRPAAYGEGPRSSNWIERSSSSNR